MESPYDCIWTTDADGTLTCSRCHVPCEGCPIENHRRNCLAMKRPRGQKIDVAAVRSKALPAAGPNAARKIANFSKALAAHLAAGSPKATQSQIDERFAICQGCEMLVSGVCSDFECGCPVNNKKKFRNKLAWADQGCPQKKWLPIVDFPAKTVE